MEQADPDAPRLDARRRNRDWEGAAGRRDHSRPLAAGGPQGALAVGIGQAHRGRATRLDGPGRTRERHRARQQVAAERPHRPGHGDPVLDLRDPAVRRPRRQPVEARADHRLASRRPGRGSAPRLERRDRLRRVARAVRGRRRPGRARRDRAQPAGTGRCAAAERPAAGTHRVRVGHRRQHDRRPLLREPAGPVGHARDALPDPDRLRAGDGRGRGGRARGGRPGLASRSGGTRPGPCPTPASRSTSSSTC